jgi:hypothetical protein
MKRASLAAAAILSTTFTPLATPAFAATQDQQDALNLYCEGLVNAVSPGHAPFQITAINVVEGATTGGNLEVTDYLQATHHGGSVNIFATVDYAITGGTTAFTFDCETFKPNANENGQGDYPNGLQFSSQTTSVPNEDTITGTGDILICISPLKNPGVWRNANGYNGELGACSTALYTASGGNTPSVSVPLI